MIPSDNDQGKNDSATVHPPGWVSIVFFKELVVFAIGLFMGFFWYLYYAKDPSTQTHIIIGLVVIIMGMGRYLYLLRYHRQRPPDRMGPL